MNLCAVCEQVTLKVPNTQGSLHVCVWNALQNSWKHTCVPTHAIGLEIVSIHQAVYSLVAWLVHNHARFLLMSEFQQEKILSRAITNVCMSKRCWWHLLHSTCGNVLHMCANKVTCVQQTKYMSASSYCVIKPQLHTVECSAPNLQCFEVHGHIWSTHTPSLSNKVLSSP